MSGRLGLLIFLLPAVLPAQGIRQPELYGKSIKAAHEAYEHYGAWDEAEERRRVNDLGYRLAVMSDFEDFPFTFYLIDMTEPNAFALPGGQIFVTRGMLRLGLDDDMLACLLGHELAHVIYKHGVRMQKRARLLNLMSTAALLGVMIGASDDRPDNPYDVYPGSGGGSNKGSLVQGTAAAGVVLSELLLRDYSRDFEDQADTEGQRLAAAAGFDPQGAHRLWSLMNSRLPPSKSYGYWRTHPFSDSRMRAAEVRAAELKILEGEPAEDYRAKVRKVVLEWGEKQNKAHDSPPDSPQDEGLELARFVQLSALHAWPQGPEAEEIRLANLHRERDDELALPETSRDYGKLIRAYRVQLEEVRALTPDSAFLATLEGELNSLRRESDQLFPKVLAIWLEGVFQTPFLETFLSNYPTAAEVPDVALALGNAYSRLGRQTDAVDHYLRASEAGPDTEAGRLALAGLRGLAPYLQSLAALQNLAKVTDEPLAETGPEGEAGDEVAAEVPDGKAETSLRRLAGQRLAELVSSYEDVADGSEYLDRYPDSELAPAVRARLETLAMNLYGEVVLYQGLGDHIKALDRIQKILTHAPSTEAAEMLRARAVVDS